MKEESVGSGDAKSAAKSERYVFFVNKQRLESEERYLKVSQIKAMANDIEPGDKLSLEGKGNEPDRLLADDETMDLAKDKGPLRFTIVPSASFGA